MTKPIRIRPGSYVVIVDNGALRSDRNYIRRPMQVLWSDEKSVLVEGFGLRVCFAKQEVIACQPATEELEKMVKLANKVENEFVIAKQKIEREAQRLIDAERTSMLGELEKIFGLVDRMRLGAHASLIYRERQ